MTDLPKSFMIYIQKNKLYKFYYDRKPSNHVTRFLPINCLENSNILIYCGHDDRKFYFYNLTKNKKICLEEHFHRWDLEEL